MLLGGLGFSFLEDVYYSTGFYWASQTMTTVGYGDLGPDLERPECLIFVCLFIFVSFGFVIPFIGFCGSLPMRVQEIRRQEALFARFGEELDSGEFEKKVSNLSHQGFKTTKIDGLKILTSRNSIENYSIFYFRRPKFQKIVLGYKDWFMIRSWDRCEVLINAKPNLTGTAKSVRFNFKFNFILFDQIINCQKQFWFKFEFRCVFDAGVCQQAWDFKIGDEPHHSLNKKTNRLIFEKKIPKQLKSDQISWFFNEISFKNGLKVLFFFKDLITNQNFNFNFLILN